MDILRELRSKSNRSFKQKYYLKAIKKLLIPTTR